MKRSGTGIFLITAYLLLICILNIVSCSCSTDKNKSSGTAKDPLSESETNRIPGYTFSAPDERIILPPVLHEISGIALISSTSVACVQDEVGVIFIYDLQKKDITRQIYFNGDGDYEGITSVNDEIYVLRSDGTLFEKKDPENSAPGRYIPLKKIPYNEFEGLCYDQKNKRLLIAPKDKPDEDSDSKNKREIYGYDPWKGILNNTPAITINIKKIKKFAAAKRITDQSKDKKDDDFDIKFNPSAIGIHPVTGKLFVLTASTPMIFVFDINGTVEHVIKLDPEIYNMPEGITFFKNGDMLISNEGQNGPATILRLNFNPI